MKITYYIGFYSIEFFKFTKKNLSFSKDLYNAGKYWYEAGISNDEKSDFEDLNQSSGEKFNFLYNCSLS